MSKKARAKPRSPSGSAGNYYPARSTPWAASESWPDLLSSRTRQRPAAKLVPRPDRRRLAAKSPPTRTVTLSKRAITNPQALFGGWELPTHTLASPAALKAATTCARRHSRRSTLFAKRLTRLGAGAPRKNFSNERCKP